MLDVKSWYRAVIGNTVIHKAWNLDRTGLVSHCFTTRTGGVSSPPHNSLNLALHVDDSPDNVISNRRLIFNSLGLSQKDMVCAEQVHGSSVAVVKADDVGRGADSFQSSIPGVDALITNEPGPVLALFYADCVPVFIVDPVNCAIGLAHAGWKGTALGVAGEAISKMREIYGSDPAECIAAIGPSIGRCCYNVSADVAEKVLAAAGDDRIAARVHHERITLDLKLANWFILRNCGLKEANIALSSLCTACEAEDFFSYRRDGATGRMAAILTIQKQAPSSHL